jgi:hypothetical protein
MLYNAILSLTLFLPLNHALSISSHLDTETTLQCSTIYSTSSPSLPLLTTTTSLHATIDLSPVILHNYTTTTITKTPKPFETLFSVLATKTRTVQREAVDGVLQVEVTKFGTKTFWHHVTTTATVTKERVLTSRTTTWISAPSGFVGVRDSSSLAVGRPKRGVKHPHTKRQSPSTSTRAILARPTQGKYAVAVHCERQIRIHTTQVLLLTASKKATVTAKRETVFKNRTVYGTVTSTILALPTTVNDSLLSSGSGSGSGSGSSATSMSRQEVSTQTTTTSPSQNSEHIITTTTTTVTKTPYTISFTYTATTTTTSTATLHATTTITSLAACASANLLGQTSGMLRVNGVSIFGDGGVEGVEDGVESARVEETKTRTAALCCEACMKSQGCLWSIYEASGEKKGSCYLALLGSNHQGEKPNGDKQAAEAKDKQQRGGKEVAEQGETEDNEAGVCTKQEKKGIIGYSGGIGEVRYVVSNGLCGMLWEAS